MPIRVLIVDDEESDVYLARYVLERLSEFGPIISERDAAEALPLFVDTERGVEKHGEAWPPQLVLLDINMPVMDGFTFLREYRALPPDKQSARIIAMLTSFDGSDPGGAGQRRPYDDYIVKPLTEARARELGRSLS